MKGRRQPILGSARRPSTLPSPRSRPEDATSDEQSPEQPTERAVRLPVEPVADAPPPSLRERLLAEERGILLATLAATDWNVSKAAKLLGLTRVGLHRKLQSFGIRRPVPPD